VLIYPGLGRIGFDRSKVISALADILPGRGALIRPTTYRKTSTSASAWCDAPPSGKSRRLRDYGLGRAGKHARHAALRRESPEQAVAHSGLRLRGDAHLRWRGVQFPST
jgi:hypothetical protein